MKLKTRIFFAGLVGATLIASTGASADTQSARNLLDGREMLCSQSVTGADECSFDCAAGETIYATAGGIAVFTSGTCGGATAVCHSLADRCSGSSTSTQDEDTGVCAAWGVGTYGCSAS